MSVELWTEKYRPKSMDEYVWSNPAMRKKVDEWVAEGALPNLMFTGGAGTGKTSLAYLLLRLLDIPDSDILYVNASKERKVEDIQSKIGNFVNTWALGPSGIKYVILDESDRISPTAQGFLRAEIEQYHAICRFILTANYRERLIPAIHSRFQEYKFKTLDEDDFLIRGAEVLAGEGVEFTEDDLRAVVKASYPDMRKCIQLLQQYTSDKVLKKPSNDDGGSSDWKIDMIDLFKAGRMTEGRKLILAQAMVEEYPDVFRFLYRNLDLFGATEEVQDKALIIIKRGVVNHTLAADSEINLAGTLCELASLYRESA